MEAINLGGRSGWASICPGTAKSKMKNYSWNPDLTTKAYVFQL